MIAARSPTVAICVLATRAQNDGPAAHAAWCAPPSVSGGVAGHTEKFASVARLTGFSHAIAANRRTAGLVPPIAPSQADQSRWIYVPVVLAGPAAQVSPVAAVVTVGDIVAAARQRAVGAAGIRRHVAVRRAVVARLVVRSLVIMHPIAARGGLAVLAAGIGNLVRVLRPVITRLARVRRAVAAVAEVLPTIPSAIIPIGRVAVVAHLVPHPQVPVPTHRRQAGVRAGVGLIGPIVSIVAVLARIGHTVPAVRLPAARPAGVGRGVGVARAVIALLPRLHRAVAAHRLVGVVLVVVVVVGPTVVVAAGDKDKTTRQYSAETSHQGPPIVRA